MAVFVNVSNHPSDKWDEKQLSAAGNVLNVVFPNVPPEATEEEIEALATKVVEDVVSRLAAAGALTNEEKRVLVQGEFSLCNEIWKKLGAMGFQPVVATSERQSVDLGDGKKTTVFKFVQFRRIRV